MTISVVQQNTGTTMSATAGSTTVVVMVGAIGSTLPTAVTIGSSSMTMDESASSTNENISVWRANNVPSGQTAITVTGAGTDSVVYFWEISGLGGAVLDVKDSATGSGASWSSGSVTSGSAVEIWLGGTYLRTTSGFPTPTGPASPWANSASETAGSNERAMFGDQITTATGSAVYSGSATGTGVTYAALVVTYKVGPLAVSIAPATVAISASPFFIPPQISPATIAIAAAGFTPKIAVSLNPAAITIAAQTVTPHGGVGVPLNPAAISVAVRAVTPQYARTVSIGTATISIAVQSVTPTVTRRLIASITATGGTDAYGNTYQAGITVYESAGNYAQLTGGTLQFQGTASQASPAYIATDGGAGLLEISSGTVSSGDSPALIDLVSADANGGVSAIDLTSADVVQIGALTLNGQTISVPQGTPPTVPGAPGSYTSTWGTGIVTALNFLIAALQDAGIVS
jgi:hypothetical protein